MVRPGPVGSSPAWSLWPGRSSPAPAAGPGPPRPAVAGDDRRVRRRRLGRRRPEEGDGLEGPLRPRAPQGHVHHRGLVQARPVRGLDQGHPRRPARRPVRPLSPHSLHPVLRPDRLQLPARRGQGRGRRRQRDDHARVPGGRYPTVVREVRDRGVVWKDYANGVRRGREMVLWAGPPGGQLHVPDAIRLPGRRHDHLPGRGDRPEPARARGRSRTCTTPTGGSTSTSSTAAKNNAMLMTHSETTSGLARRGRRGAVQLGRRGRDRVGPQAVHDDPGPVREAQRQRQEDRLRPDADPPGDRRGTRSRSPTTTSG